MKNTYFITLIMLSAAIYWSCSTTKPTSNPLWTSDCPFAGLEFTHVAETDSFSRTSIFNDSLKIALESDLKELKGTGKVGNNLEVALNKLTTGTRKRTVKLDDADYIQWIQDKTKTLCGLHSQLKEGKIYTTKTSRAAAESKMLELIDGLSVYSKKKQIPTQG